MYYEKIGNFYLDFLKSLKIFTNRILYLLTYATKYVNISILNKVIIFKKYYNFFVFRFKFYQ